MQRENFEMKDFVWQIVKLKLKEMKWDEWESTKIEMWKFEIKTNFFFFGGHMSLWKLK